MLKVVGEELVFFWKFTESNTGKTGLTPTVQVYRNRVSLALVGATATHLAGGVYYYLLDGATYNTVAGDYLGQATTAVATVDQKIVDALWIVRGFLEITETGDGSGLGNTLTDLLWQLRDRLNDHSQGAYLTATLTHAINLAYRDAVVAAKCRKATKSIALVAGTHTYDCAEIFEPIEVALGSKMLTPRTIGALGISLERWNAEPQGEPEEWVPLNGGYIRLHKTPSATYSTTGAITALVTAPIAGGTGYAVDDVLTITDGSASGGTAKVTAVTAGVVTAVELLTSGYGYSTGTKGTTVSPAGGANCTVSISAISSLTVHGYAHPTALANGTDTPDSLPDGYAIEAILDGAESYARGFRPTVEMWWGRIRESCRG